MKNPKNERRLNKHGSVQIRFQRINGLSQLEASKGLLEYCLASIKQEAELPLDSSKWSEEI